MNPGKVRMLMKHWLVKRQLALAICWLCAGLRAQSPEPPRSPNEAVKISLFAAEPEIVTPIGATVDAKGRLLVVESHSHFRPRNYKGPATDRIRILEDTNGDGKADRFSTFYEGTNYVMNIVADADGSVVVSSRNEIFRAFEGGLRVSLAKLETKSDYPHNGLDGLAIDKDGDVYFGIGENLGGPWKLVTIDRAIGDKTGTGAVFRIDKQGRGLARVAKGFWNPFGLGVDPVGNVWAVDNDPDGRPPCRLINVALGGDYGFEFRYGRTGMHPLQAWDAELPGTLGMVCGVGEGPCAVRWHRGGLLVSSWRDHQVERYALHPKGASYSASMEPLLTGGESFRPVGLAPAPDGSLFVTDWGSGSYEINRLGRVWKVTFAGAAPVALETKPTAEMERAERLRESKNVPDLVAGLDDADPAIAQAAQYGLSRLAEVEKIGWDSLDTPRKRIGFLAALLGRGSDVTAYLGQALKDSNDRVRQMAVRAIAEEEIVSAKAQLEELLGSEVLSPRLLGMTVAAIGQLGGDPSARIDAKKIDAVLLSRMSAAQATDEAKTAALHMLQASHPAIGTEQLRAFLRSPSLGLQMEVVRYLDSDLTPGRFAVLAEVAGDEKRYVSVRAESVLGLADDAAGRMELLMQLAGDQERAIRQEALRSLRPIASKLSKVDRDRLVNVAKRYSDDADLVERLMATASPARPAETDFAAWRKIVDQAPGDPEAGRRIFFHHGGPGCYRCHMIEGRGRTIGPDLTMIGHSRGRQHVLESILDPSREIAPLYTLWSITQRSGDRIDAMLLRRDGSAMEIYVDSNAQEIKVPEKNIVGRKMRKESLMPTGLASGMTDQELRDLLAFLTTKR
jgi:putative membrane-bound dehydrogenase-like protein